MQLYVKRATMLHTISQKCAYIVDSQYNNFAEFCAMKLHLGQEIDRVRKLRKMSNKDLADRLNTNVRSLYYMKAEEDVSTLTLFKLSEILNYNFFQNLHPVVVSPDHVLMDDIKQYKTKKEEELKVNLEVRYPIRLSNELGKFIMHVKEIGDKLGFKIN